MEKFTPVEKEDIVDILQEIIDLGYKIMFRTADKGIFVYKHGDYDQDYGANALRRIDYEEICGPLIEAIDRLGDLYKIEMLFINPLADRSIKYSEVPDSINFSCIGITIVLSPKSKFNRIKNFLNFN